MYDRKSIREMTTSTKHIFNILMELWLSLQNNFIQNDEPMYCSASVLLNEFLLSWNFVGAVHVSQAPNPWLTTVVQKFY